MNRMISDAKSKYYSSIISENKCNQRVLFNTVKRMLHRKTENHYPTARASKDEFVNNFVGVFFSEKISKLRNALSTQSVLAVDPLPVVHCCRADFTGFWRVGSDDLIKILGPGLKSSDLDPFPSTLMKGCIDIILPVCQKLLTFHFKLQPCPNISRKQW